MEEKINIVEILKDKPQGTKLYSSAYCFIIKTKKKNVLKLMSSIQRLGIVTLKAH